MVSSSNEALPPLASNADLPDSVELAHKYLNDDEVSRHHPSSSPMASSRGMTPSSDGKPQNSSNTSTNANNGGDSRTASEGPGRQRGARSVSKLTPAQLQRKRANDREAQRAIRQRTKEHIENLEREIQELKQHGNWEVQQRNRELEETVVILRQQLEDLRMQRDALAAGQGVPLPMGTEGQDMNWPLPTSMAYDGDMMTSFDPSQSIEVSREGDLTGPGNDIVTAYANNPGVMTPYASESPTAGNFPDMDASSLNYGPIPGQEMLQGLSNDMATPTWTENVNQPFQMGGDPSMFRPPNKYLNTEDVPYPYNTQPSTLPPQPQRQKSQLEPPPMQPSRSDPGMNIKYELSPTPMPNLPQRMRTPQPMRQAQSSLPTPPEQEMQQRRQQQQQQQQQPRSQQQGMHHGQRPLAPNLQPKPPQNQPQLQRQTSLASQVGGIPIAPAPPPPAHLQRSQRSQPSSQNIPQNLPPVQAEQQLQQQRQLQQQQQQTLQGRSRQIPPQQLQGNMSLQSPPQGQRGRQPSIQYWSRTPTFLPPTNFIDSLLHSALAQHRASVLNGGTNRRAPDYSSLLSFNNPTAPNPLLARGGDPSPLSSAISRAIQVAGLKGIATQAAVLYTTHCLLRWQSDPRPETYCRVPEWLRPGEMQLQVVHALWVSQLVWRGLRERVASNGGRYVKDEFILAYARNLELDWGKGQRTLTGNQNLGPGLGDGIFELSESGEVVTTGKFEAAVREQCSWGLRGEFFVLYPELRELVNRARD